VKNDLGQDVDEKGLGERENKKKQSRKIKWETIAGK